MKFNPLKQEIRAQLFERELQLANKIALEKYENIIDICKELGQDPSIKIKIVVADIEVTIQPSKMAIDNLLDSIKESVCFAERGGVCIRGNTTTKSNTHDTSNSGVRCAGSSVFKGIPEPDDGIISASGVYSKKPIAIPATKECYSDVSRRVDDTEGPRF